MKYIYVMLILSFVATGCGYKGPPVYVDDTVEKSKK